MRTYSIYTTVMFIIGTIVLFVISIVLSLTVGLFELPDGFFYLNLGQFLLTNQWIPVHPFNEITPQTLYGPVYSLILGLLLQVQGRWGTTFVVFFQLSCLLFSSVVVSYLAYHYLRIRKRLLVMIGFICTPFSLIYATTLMSELTAMGIISLWLVLTSIALRRKAVVLSAFVVLIATVLTLTKNAYIFFIPLSMLLWGYVARVAQHKGLKIRLFYSIIPFVLSCILLISWLRFNQIHQGNTGLTNYTGRHWFNNVVRSGKLLPDESEPVYQRFLYRAEGDKSRLLLPEWEVQLLFIPEIRNGSLTETGMDKEFKEFAIAGIRKQPFAYVGHVVKTFLNNMITAPFHSKLLAALGFVDPTCLDCQIPLSCRFSWLPNACDSKIPSSFMKQVWGLLLLMNRACYPWAALLLFSVFIIGFIGSLIKRHWFIVLCGALFIVTVGLHSMAQQVEGRYVIPSYPFYSLVLLQGFLVIHEFFRFVQKVLSIQHKQESS